LTNEGCKTVFFGGSMDMEAVKEAVSFMKTKPIIATAVLLLGS
jgi:heptosyltransferase-2